MKSIYLNLNDTGKCFLRFRMKLIIIFLMFISIILCSFQIKNNAVVIEQVDSNLPIIIRYDSVKDHVFRIQLPLVYRIRNISDHNKQIGQIGYEDTTLQSLFRPFIPQLKESHKDTLYISTIRMFKENYPEIIHTLL